MVAARAGATIRAALRAALGVLLGVVARLWLSTLRVRVEVHPDLRPGAEGRAGAEGEAGAPWVLAFLHGAQWPLLAWKRRRGTVVMVSHSNDGAMQARALGLLGFHVVRGSSSRGGARGLAALVRRMRRASLDAAFAVDGPRGPYGVPKPGAVLAARKAGALLVPMGAAVARGKTLDRAWDRFTLAWPFTTVAVVLGSPVDTGGEPEAACAALAEAIRGATARASRLLEAPEGGALGSESVTVTRG